MCEYVSNNRQSFYRHLLYTHQIDKNTYILIYIYNNQLPLCKCGCGRTVKLSDRAKEYPYHCDYFSSGCSKQGKKQNEEYKTKRLKATKEAVIKKYGVTTYFKTDEFKETSKKACLEKFGTEYAIQNKDIKEKRKDNNMEKYGVRNVHQLQEVIDKTKETNLEKYGHECPIHNPEIRKKVIKTWMRNLDVDNPGKSKISQEKVEISFRNNHNGKTRKQFLQEIKINRNTKPELEFKSLLKNSNINFIHQFSIDGKKFDFYLPDKNLLIEINGPFWHGENRNDSYSLVQISSMINDEIKRKIAKANNYELKYLSASNLPNLITNFEEKFYDSYKSFNPDTIILTKDYLLKYREEHGDIKFESYFVPLTFYFFRTFFPYFTLPNRNIKLENELKETSKFTYDFLDEIIHSKINSKGTAYLKSKFLSYWKGKSMGSVSSIFDAYQDDDILKKVIKYRLGLNKTKETFDISYNNLIRGFSGYRLNLSFFPPRLAKIIFDKYLKNIDNPTIYDPCAGFGGRMLGFISFLNGRKGKYVCNEINEETYNELIDLSKELKILNKEIEIEVYNESAVTFSLEKLPDLVFTCFPYFNKENYKDKLYQSKEEWKTNFLYTIIDKYYKQTICIFIVDDILLEMIKEKYEIKEIITIKKAKHPISKSSGREFVIIL